MKLELVTYRWAYDSRKYSAWYNTQAYVHDAHICINFETDGEQRRSIFQTYIKPEHFEKLALLMISCDAEKAEDAFLRAIVRYQANLEKNRPIKVNLTQPASVDAAETDPRIPGWAR